MLQTHTFTQKLRQFFIILIPILITQVSMFLMNFFDTIMSGQFSAIDLAGVAIGSSIWLPIFTGLSGILLAVTPITAQLVGAKQIEKIPHAIIQALYLSLVISAAIFLLGFALLNPLLQVMDLEASVRHIALHYLIGLSFGIIPLFAYTVLRSFIDALGLTRLTMLLSLLSLPINVALNYMMIFGKLGFPPLGGIGAGYATAITYWFILICCIFMMQKLAILRKYRIFAHWVKISFSKWRELLVIGLPIGFAIFFETSIFAAVTLLMSSFTTTTIAAHQIAINFSSLLYMIPMSISMALTISVGFEIGAKRYTDAKQYSKLGISFSLLTGMIAMICLFVFHGQLASWYTNEAPVIELAKQFLIYAIFFQLSDAIAAPIQGILRGYKDVKVTFYLALLSFWIIGLPTGYILATFSSLGPFGYWVGLITGLLSGAICLGFRLHYVQKKFANAIAAAN